MAAGFEISPSGVSLEDSATNSADFSLVERISAIWNSRERVFAFGTMRSVKVDLRIYVLTMHSYERNSTRKVKLTGESFKFQNSEGI